jgi:hypothetical protein
MDNSKLKEGKNDDSNESSDSVPNKRKRVIIEEEHLFICHAPVKKRMKIVEDEDSSSDL